MQIGKIPENVLKRSVIKQIKVDRPEVLLGAGVGEDCSVLKLDEDECFVLSTDPITGTAKDIGHLAVNVTVNDLCSAGAEPVGILLTVLLPENTEEAELKQIMQDTENACEKLNVQVIGGHTEVTKAVNVPIISVTGVAKVKKGRLVVTGGAEPGMDIIVSKWIGLEGSSIIAKEKREELLTKIPESIVNAARDFDTMLSVYPESKVAVEHGVSAMHDITEGGVFGALWEMAEASGCGLSVDLRAIPIRQETVEICEFYDINPYELISSGSMLIAANDGEGLLKKMEEAGIYGSIVGRMTEGNDRIIMNKGEKRYLEPPKADELYKVV